MKGKKNRQRVQAGLTVLAREPKPPRHPKAARRRNLPSNAPSINAQPQIPTNPYQTIGEDKEGPPRALSERVRVCGDCGVLCDGSRCSWCSGNMFVLLTVPEAKALAKKYERE